MPLEKILKKSGIWHFWSLREHQEKKSTIEGQDVLEKYLFKKYPSIALLVFRKKSLKITITVF